MTQINDFVVSYFSKPAPVIRSFVDNLQPETSADYPMASFITAAGLHVYRMANYDQSPTDGPRVTNKIILENALRSAKAIANTGSFFIRSMSGDQTAASQLPTYLSSFPDFVADASRHLQASARTIRAELQSLSPPDPDVISLPQVQARHGIPTPFVQAGKLIDQAFTRSISLKNLPNNLPDAFSINGLVHGDFDAKFRQLGLAMVLRESLSRTLAGEAQRLVRAVNGEPEATNKGKVVSFVAPKHATQMPAQPAGQRQGKVIPLQARKSSGPNG